MVDRKPTWRATLTAAVSRDIKAPFQYGKRDCSLTAANIIRDMTGTDLMEGIRGRYRSAAGAVRVVHKSGKIDLLSLVRERAEAAGFPEIETAAASMGDLILTDTALGDNSVGQACGICLGNSAIFPGDVGWVHLPRKAWIAAFKIG